MKYISEDRSCSWQNMDVTLDENNTITVVDILNETKEELDFRDRVTDMSLAHGALVVNTNSQCFVYQSSNWNTPHVEDLKEPAMLIVQCLFELQMIRDPYLYINIIYYVILNYIIY